MGFWSALFSPGVPAQTPATRSKTDVAADDSERQRRSSAGIHYRLQRGRRKSIGLIITTDGLLIRAPRWTPIYEIDAAISERRDWIETALTRQSARREQLASYRDGGHILFRGHKLKVDLRAGLFESVDLTERHCVLTTADGQFATDALDAEIKRVARLELPVVAREMATAAGLPLQSVSLSSARTMWGSCTSDGRVRLNFRLIQLPPELMRHVVAHELAHLVEFNHSKRFWAIVDQLDPKSRTHKRAIKNYSVLLEL